MPLTLPHSSPPSPPPCRLSWTTRCPLRCAWRTSAAGCRSCCCAAASAAAEVWTRSRCRGSISQGTRYGGGRRKGGEEQLRQYSPLPGQIIMVLHAVSAAPSTDMPTPPTLCSHISTYSHLYGCSHLIHHRSARIAWSCSSPSAPMWRSCGATVHRTAASCCTVATATHATCWCRPARTGPRCERGSECGDGGVGG